jgi:hypothetical protein
MDNSAERIAALARIIAILEFQIKKTTEKYNAAWDGIEWDGTYDSMVAFLGDITQKEREIVRKYAASESERIIRSKYPLYVAQQMGLLNDAAERERVFKKLDNEHTVLQLKSERISDTKVRFESYIKLTEIGKLYFEKKEKAFVEYHGRLSAACLDQILDVFDTFDLRFNIWRLNMIDSNIDKSDMRNLAPSEIAYIKNDWFEMVYEYCTWRKACRLLKAYALNPPDNEDAIVEAIYNKTVPNSFKPLGVPAHKFFIKTLKSFGSLVRSEERDLTDQMFKEQFDSIKEKPESVGSIQSFHFQLVYSENTGAFNLMDPFTVEVFYALFSKVDTKASPSREKGFETVKHRLQFFDEQRSKMPEEDWQASFRNSVFYTDPVERERVRRAYEVINERNKRAELDAAARRLAQEEEMRRIQDELYAAQNPPKPKTVMAAAPQGLGNLLMSGRSRAQAAIGANTTGLTDKVKEAIDITENGLPRPPVKKLPSNAFTPPAYQKPPTPAPPVPTNVASLAQNLKLVVQFPPPSTPPGVI